MEPLTHPKKRPNNSPAERSKTHFAGIWGPGYSPLQLTSALKESWNADTFTPPDSWWFVTSSCWEKKKFHIKKFSFPFFFFKTDFIFRAVLVHIKIEREAQSFHIPSAVPPPTVTSWVSPHYCLIFTFVVKFVKESTNNDSIKYILYIFLISRYTLFF